MFIINIAHENWPRGRPTVTAGSDHYFHTCCPSVSKSPLFKISKNKKLSSENYSDRYWRDCGSVRVDHWWHTSCIRLHLWIVGKTFFRLRNSSKSQDGLTNGVDDGNVENGLEFSKERVWEEGTNEGSEVRQEDESVVNDGGNVLGLVRVPTSDSNVQVSKVQGQNSAHSIVTETFTSLRWKNEENTFWIGYLLQFIQFVIKRLHVGGWFPPF